MEALRDLLLETFVSLPEGQELAQEELIKVVQARSRQAGKRPPSQSEISGRLTTLRKEGVVERRARGRYRLTRSDQMPTALERRVGERLKAVLRPEQLARLVLWEATPYLDWTEDGAPGPRLVVEQPQAGQLREAVVASWPRGEQPAAWVVKVRRPVGGSLWTDPLQTVLPGQAGVVLVEADRIGGTAVVKAGYRIPFRERILCDFVGLDGPDADLGVPVVENILLREGSEVSFERLWQSGAALKTETELAALLARLFDRLDPQLRAAYRSAMSPTVGAFLEGKA